jgi:hypothetical protein
MDRGAVIRLRTAIEATLREQGSYPSYTEGLVEADHRFRSAIRELVQGDAALAIEFNALFPPAVSGPRPAGPPGGDHLERAGMTKNARMHLAGMSGWLLGLIDSPTSTPSA